METIDIARKDWGQVLDRFSAVHEGWLVSLDFYEPACGTQPQLRRVPLVGVTAEPEARDTNITIAAARDGRDHFAHTVVHPRNLRLERTNDGGIVALAIEAADGTTAILRVNTPGLPETVDELLRVH